MQTAQPKKIVFLCSGGGGNLCFIHEAITRGWIDDVEIVAVLTDRNCQASAFAASVGLSHRLIDFSVGDQDFLLKELMELEPDLVITTVHKILRKQIVDKFRGKLLNLHYSLLPAFGGLIGMRSVRAAIEYGAQFTGVTTHLVDESVDGGAPIVQAVIPLHAGEQISDALKNLVFRCGCLALLLSIDLRLNDKSANQGAVVEIMGRNCIFGGGLVNPFNGFINEPFWQHITTKLAAIPSQA